MADRGGNNIIKVGVLGVGYIGKNHARILSDMPGVELSGVCDNDGDKAVELASAHDTGHCAGADELFAASDAVVIALPTVLHHEFARRALEAGLDVLVEKPITQTLEEARDLCALADANSRVLQVGHVERFNPVVSELPRLVKDPLYFSCERLSPFAPAWVSETGVTLDLMIHDLDMVLSLVPSEPTTVNAVCTREKSESEDLAVAQVRFANGVLANFVASRISQAKVRRITITQPDEYISCDLVRQTIAIHHYISSDYYFDARMGYKQETVTEIPYLSRHGEPLRFELESFVECVSTREKPVVSGEDGMRALILAQRIMEACARTST